MKFLLAAIFLVGVWGAEAPLRLGERVAPAEVVAGFEGGKFSTLDREVFVWVGGENSVIEQDFSWIEAHLVSALQGAGKRGVVRHMGWEGDTVFRQNRMATKNAKRRRSLGASKEVDKTDAYRITQNLPFSH